MKTAMQDLIRELEQFKKFPMVDKATIEAAIDFAKIRIETEREQIMQAFVDGDNRGKGEITFNCEQYYSQTFEK